MSSIRNLMHLGNRRALITGATGNLGRVIADTLAELGATLILVDRPEADFSSLCEALAHYPDVKIECKPCDLELAEERQALVHQINDDGQGLHILINNAAFVGSTELQGWAVPFEEQTVETWRRAIEVNLTATFDLCQKLTPLLQQAQGASIINIASIYGLLGPDWELYAGTNMSNPAAYSASKGGLIQFSRWLATTIKPQVRVNSISPGGIFRNQPDAFVQRYEARVPLGRMATEDDFKGAVAYLASDLSRYVTGQNLIVDGGWSAW
jgi:NAD(P)-dependent dehydrogenase (short-subunit alcohol dehydrogenase family)